MTEFARWILGRKPAAPPTPVYPKILPMEDRPGLVTIMEFCGAPIMDCNPFAVQRAIRRGNLPPVLMKDNIGYWRREDIVETMMKVRKEGRRRWKLENILYERDLRRKERNSGGSTSDSGPN